MDLKRQKFMVFGVSKSGVSATKLLLKSGAYCCFYEQLSSPKIEKSKEELIALGAVDVGEKAEEALENVDVLVLSPGVAINHPLAIRAKKSGKRILGELELGYLMLKTPIVAVTGTNGKTTTVSMIGSILERAKVTHLLVGNIGNPLTGKIKELNEGALAITEVSSFQLETVHLFTPHIACILNLSPDHLERHYSYENYVYLKKRILKNMRESEYAVLNYDDETVRGFADDQRAKIVWFSLKERVFGAYCGGEELFYNDRPIMRLDELSLVGEHNLQNALACIAVCKLLGVSDEDIRAALMEFKGVRHRIEFVKTVDGVNFYNDSKGTNTGSTISAIRSMNRPTVLILGGKDKGEAYEELFRVLRENAVTHAVLVGESRYKMMDAAARVGFERITVTGDFEGAIRIAKMFCEPSGNVLFSPACASFDMFENYEKRGEEFCKIVGEMT